MSYLFSKGNRLFGDLEFEDDTNTQIDFEDDYIGLVADGKTQLAVSGSRVGIGIDEPDTTFHVVANDARVRIEGDVDSHPGLELSEGGTRKWIVYNNYTNDNLTFKTNSNIRMVIEQGGNVGIGTNDPATALDVDSDSIRIRNTKTPSNASDTGVAGQICWDSNYLYICVATNTWKRVPIDPW
tara:strand:- start:51 stop:599 length:549 start_codon:yes stop_codon:yes gene_type:complete